MDLRRLFYSIIGIVVVSAAGYVGSAASGGDFSVLTLQGLLQAVAGAIAGYLGVAPKQKSY